jgi:ATP-binding cassette subfamily B protein
MSRALSRLLPYLLRVRGSMIAGLAAALVATSLSLVSPWVLKYVVDGLTQGVDRGTLGLYALSILALAAADGIFRYLMRNRLIGASRQVEYDLRNDFFAHLQRLPLGYFQSHRTGDLMSRATNDLAAVRMLVGPAVMYSTSTVFGFVIAISVMLWIDLRLTLVALLPLPGVTVATWYFGRAIHDRFEHIQAKLAGMSAVVQEALSGVRVVRAYRQEAAELARFRASNDEYVASNDRLIRIQSAFYPSLTLCFGLSGLLVIWLGGTDVVRGRLTLGEFVAFSRYLVLLAWPLIAFGWVINIVQRGLASWERMLEVLDAPPAEEDTRPRDQAVLSRLTDQGARRGPGRIEVRDLTFAYPGTTVNVLQGVSFVADPGQTVAIVGPTGSGKSTISSLICRLHEPPPGTVFVDDVDVRDQALARLRASIGVVPQEPFLFSDTVGGNVVFGLNAEWSDETARASGLAAGATARLDVDVADFPAGYETMVGERGVTLSGGQKQRVAIARAVATDPRILILDDALSAVDTATEERILQQLREVRRRTTCLMIAHRISTVRDADLILVLVGGRVIERGEHDALVAMGGVYAQMHERQMLEEELAST